ncbi:MAG TPA: protein kinase [Terriglobia bacterium]
MSQRIADALSDRYQLDRELGAGGMATVYAARDLRHDRFVAIKVMRPEVCEATSTERFLREIRIAAQLTHPHILPLIDSGESCGVMFYVMPLIDGETLRTRMARAGELPVPESLHILRYLLDALAYAHTQGVVHRDLKPENILLSDGHAYVTDFGIAKALVETSGATWASTRLTAMGTIVGTPSYMAPEQVGGAVVDHRTDLYAMGIVAYEMLTGHLPFTLEKAQQVMAAHLAMPPEPIAKWRPAVPLRLANAVMKCLEKRPADRWQSAAEMLAEIEAVSATEGKTPAGGEIECRLIERRFTLTERVCRKLNRATLDPRIIGDSLRYADNQVNSDVLVCLLHGLGLGHRELEPHLKRLPYRGVSPSLYNYETDRHPRISLSLADHIVILREWLLELIERSQASTVVLVGLSCGTDIWLQLLLNGPSPRIDGLLGLGCNLSIDTCFVSRVLARMAPDKPEVSIAELRRFGETAESLDEWLNVHEYLVRVLRKFEGDMGVLQRAAAEIVGPFKDTQDFATFAQWFKGARQRVPALRLVFSSDSGSQAALARLKLKNLDTGILGEEFPESIITVAPDVDHFQLMGPESVAAHVDEVVTEARTRRRPSHL